jgi:thiol-disulfide isomerase/thioredoxin
MQIHKREDKKGFSVDRSFRVWAVAIPFFVLIAGGLFWKDIPRRAWKRTKKEVQSRGYFLPVPTPVARPAADADFNLPLQSLDGKSVSLRDLKGNVIFLNVWASWCAPCRSEMPGIARLYQESGSDEVAFVMLAIDENHDMLRRYLDQKGYGFPVYLPAAPLPAAYLTQSIPATFVIDRQGQIVFRHEGVADYDSPDFKAFLSKLSGQ